MMAFCFACVADNCVQMNSETGQLEIYETRAEAQVNCRPGVSVVFVQVTPLLTHQPPQQEKPE